MINPGSVDWRLYVIIDPAAIPESSPMEIAESAIAGGAGVIQLRDKRANSREVLALAEQLARVCRHHNIPFIVNDRVDIALAAGADGVHVGPHDLSVDAVRRIAPNLLVGSSAGTPDVARELVADGAHYLGSGAVFDASGSKPDAHHNRGLEALREVVKAVDVPVVGIGGINASNTRLVRKTGAAGVAVIRAVCAATDPQEAARAVLREACS